MSLNFMDDKNLEMEEPEVGAGGLLCAVCATCLVCGPTVTELDHLTALAAFPVPWL